MLKAIDIYGEQIRFRLNNKETIKQLMEDFLQ